MVDHKESLPSLTKDLITKEFKGVFEGIWCFEQAYHVELKSDAAPVCEPPRRVLFALHESLKIKLHSMEEQGVIKRWTNLLNRSTTWWLWKRKTRIRLDPCNLNIYLKNRTLWNSSTWAANMCLLLLISKKCLEGTTHWGKHAFH